MIVLFINCFMKTYAVGTQDHYNHLVFFLAKFKYATTATVFYEEISKALSDSFYCRW